MAALGMGFALGICAGTLLRDQYEFPTSEKVQEALKLFERNQAEYASEIEQVQKEAEKRVVEETTKKTN